MIDPRTPVLVGAGQVTVHWNGEGDAPDPAGLRAQAARAALADAGPGVAAIIDRVVTVRTMADSVPGAPQPFGRCANPPATLAADLSLGAAHLVHSAVGGDQPQALVNEAAAAIHAGDARGVLIAGGEATAALKTALKRGQALDWSRGADGALEDRGLGAPLLSDYERANGLGAPVLTYPLFEQALRGRWGLSRGGHAARMAALWAGYSRIAAANPDSQFPTERGADFLMTPSAENYPVADPYLKWHVAQDAVNQAAALVLVSTAEADRLGIAHAARVYLHGHAEVADATPTARPDPSRSRAMALVLEQALAASGRRAEEMAAIDLYSCFPCAVLIAAEALGIDPLAVPTTVTGGLPFFGGPGNSYSLHAIATMAARLRAAPGSFGLVLANGGFLSKQAAGVYSTSPPAGWVPQSSAALAAAINAEPGPPLVSADCTGRVESYSVGFDRGVPARGYVLARTGDGGRALARVARDDAVMLQALLAHDPLGAPVSIARVEGRNIVRRLGDAA
ncbi:hypothetical protein [Sphingomonas sp.]|uniref:hypothetical protein n=1 Tax=Sphingomonas sp. TaxID=28214 RepID=UPI001D42BDB6|nr:hypothetical protein [Sphingomonas sp.]MBX9796533.1 hypothetical protein [Sphingomonas sp.]